MRKKQHVGTLSKTKPFLSKRASARSNAQHQKLGLTYSGGSPPSAKRLRDLQQIYAKFISWIVSVGQQNLQEVFVGPQRFVCWRAFVFLLWTWLELAEEWMMNWLVKVGTATLTRDCLNLLRPSLHYIVSVEVKKIQTSWTLCDAVTALVFAPRLMRWRTLWKGWAAGGSSRGWKILWYGQRPL